MNSQIYDFTLQYQPGLSIPVSDALSRAPLSTSSSEHVAESVNNIMFSPIPPGRLEEIRPATANDGTLIQLKDIIIKGWPDQKVNLPSCLSPYCNYRDELTIQDGIIIRSDRVVIPTALRVEMKSS